MSLYIKHRPDGFNKVTGNKKTIEVLENFIEKGNPPHAYLFTGESGCGKTTLSRILAKQLGAVGSDLREVNTADNRGIDTIREIIKKSQFKALEGKVKVWLIDECFSKDTKIMMSTGREKEIQNVKKGDSVKNITGVGEVLNTFINKVALDRLFKIVIDANNVIYCSDSHLFMTDIGWVKAKNLTNRIVFLDRSSKFAVNINSLKPFSKNEKMSVLRERAKKKSKKVLFKFMFKQRDSSVRRKGGQDMSDLQEEIQYKEIISSHNVRDSMRKQTWGAKKKRISCNKTKESSNKRSSTIFPSDTQRETECCNFIKKNESKQSLQRCKNIIKSKGNQTDKWNASCMARKKRRKWAIYRTSETISNFFRVGNGNCNKNKCSKNKRGQISNKLQSGLRKQGFKISNRSRWEGTLLEKDAIIRQQENQEIRGIRVESVEVYERGNNDESFKSIITDKERNQRFVELYDLQVSSHASYYANGIAVHNCHKITNDGQNALLKILEDTPKHVYFILCTTDPQKLIAAIKNRCQQFQVTTLNDREIYKILKRTVIAEGETLDKEVYDQIIQDCVGTPRLALQILEQVLAVDEDKRLDTAKQKAAEYSEVIELCRALLNNNSWKVIAGILKGIKTQEPESIRRMVLGYAQAILLNGQTNDRAGLVLQEFAEPTYNSGFVQITYACYSVCRNE